jgi:hypothetical protein
MLRRTGARDMLVILLFVRPTIASSKAKSVVMSTRLAVTVFASVIAAWHPGTTVSARIHSAPRFLCEVDTNMSPAAVNRRRRDAVATAAVVFSGKVIAVDRVKVRFEVETVWKGDAAKQLILATGMPEDSDVWVEDVYQFVREREYLVYASFRRGALSTDACTRTMPFVDASDEIRELDLMLRRRNVK